MLGRRMSINFSNDGVSAVPQLQSDVRSESNSSGPAHASASVPSSLPPPALTVAGRGEAHRLRSLYDQSVLDRFTPTREVQPKITLDPNLPSFFTVAAEYVSQGLKSKLPNGWERSYVTMKPASDDPTPAWTEVSKEDKMACITVNSARVGNEDTLENRAQAVLILTHELSLHAFPDLRTLSKHEEITSDEVSDHRRVFTPADESNEYLQVVRNVLSCLPSADLKASYLSQYVNEVENMILTAAADDDEVRILLDTFHAPLLNAAKNLDDPLWRSR